MILDIKIGQRLISEPAELGIGEPQHLKSAEVDLGFPYTFRSPRSETVTIDVDSLYTADDPIPLSGGLFYDPGIHAGYLEAADHIGSGGEAISDYDVCNMLVQIRERTGKR